MRHAPHLEKKAVIIAIVGLIAATTVLLTTGETQPAGANSPAGNAVSNAALAEAAVDLSPSQLNAIKIETLGTCLFPVEKAAVGNIDYVDDLSVPVFPPYQGKVLKAFAGLGDNVKKGQPLYTIDSPDLLQAESSLVADAATLELTTKELARAKELYATNEGVSQRELEQATTDHRTAEGALKAAEGALRIFGKSDAEIAQIIAARKIDSSLVVRSPIAGQVTFFSAPPGLMVQPGNAPAPFMVSDISVKWMVASVIESDAPLYHAGQTVEVKVMAYPDRVFTGKISKVYEAVDPIVHTMLVRSEIPDPNNELRPGMLANFVIRVQNPVEATAIPVNGVVRNGDGTFAAWITTDRRHFIQKIVRIGLQRDGRYQVLDGLRPGELAVTDGAIFLNNILEAPPSD